MVCYMYIYSPNHVSKAQLPLLKCIEIHKNIKL